MKRRLNVYAATVLTALAVVGCSTETPPEGKSEKPAVRTLTMQGSTVTASELSPEQTEFYDWMKQATPQAEKLAADKGEDGAWMATASKEELGLTSVDDEVYFGVWGGSLWGSEMKGWNLQGSKALDQDSFIYNSADDAYYLYSVEESTEIPQNFEVGVRTIAEGMKMYREKAGEWPALAIVDPKGLKIGNEMFEEGPHDVFVELPEGMTYMGTEYIDNSVSKGPRVIQVRNEAMESVVYYFEGDRLELRLKRKIVE